MKTIQTPSPLRTLLNQVLFAGFVLATPSLFAQTYTGRERIDPSPGDLQSIVYAVANQPMIRINLQNQLRGGTRIQILDKNRQSLYDEYVWAPNYSGRFDIAALPNGIYQVVLSNAQSRRVHEFRVEPPTTTRVSMLNPRPPRSDSLVVKQ